MFHKRSDKMDDIQILEDMRDEINGYLWEEDDYQMSAKAQKQFDALNWAIKKLKEKPLDDNVYRFENALSGQSIAYYLQERAKDPNIIYLTNDIVMDTDTVKSLANYIEGLESTLIIMNDKLVEIKKVLGEETVQLLML